ncbi:hypothetical protein SUGI_0939740 [Cryptomeria japonica]|uniref:DNA mismatch repair protein MSH1, mitochondrial-like n=1 Tax=Cryptomeria japonica TaxID=3369 RepID=UPI002414BECE|nr:DNA mismatch repair protein MSH1, mitochondrial-like [Cryptomeria japonica]GLJ44700.1 hypothetical protein SUGI_0939740 [Cryptomeria japonica]
MSASPAREESNYNSLSRTKPTMLIPSAAAKTGSSMRSTEGNKTIPTSSGKNVTPSRSQSQSGSSHFVICAPILCQNGSFRTRVTECREIVDAIGKVIFLEGESEQEIYSSPIIPDDFFFIEMESSWKGRIKRVHAEDVFVEVEKAAEALSLAVEEDFLPIILRVKAVVSPLGSGAKGEICYSKDHESIWFKGKCFAPAVWANTPGEEQMQNLIPAKDAKGKKVGTEWYTTPKVEEALDSYREAVVQANLKVTEILRRLAEELQRRTNTIVFLSVLSVITKTLFAHVSEGRRRDWIFPMLKGINQNPNSLHFKTQETSGEVINQLEVVGLVPYWFDLVQGAAVPNTIQMQSLFLLTGPNGGGKSSVLRSICAMTLLGICGLMVPAEKSTIPHFDSIMLHMMSYDSPANGKSSFQMEMSEMRSILSEATNKSLVLVDEICRGTEVQKGTCIAASMIEKLDSIGCIGVISTHLHGLLDLPLKAKNIVNKARRSHFHTYRKYDLHLKRRFRKPQHPSSTTSQSNGKIRTSMAAPKGLKPSKSFFVVFILQNEKYTMECKAFRVTKTLCNFLYSPSSPLGFPEKYAK